MNLQESKSSLQTLAEKHCCSKLAPTAYTFQLDQLRALIKEVVGEPVVYYTVINGVWDSYSKKLPPEDSFDEGTLQPLYAIPDEVLKC